MEVLIIVWVCGWIVTTLHLTSLGIAELNAVGVGFLLSWFYWAFWFDDKRIAAAYMFILMTIFVLTWIR